MTITSTGTSVCELGLLVVETTPFQLEPSRSLNRTTLTECPETEQIGVKAMKLNRSGEQGSVPERHDRFFQNDEYWYYTTREGVDIGPFDTLETASQGADEFIEFISNAEPSFSDTLVQYSTKAVA